MHRVALHIGLCVRDIIYPLNPMALKKDHRSAESVRRWRAHSSAAKSSRLEPAYPEPGQSARPPIERLGGQPAKPPKTLLLDYPRRRRRHNHRRPLVLLLLILYHIGIGSDRIVCVCVVRAGSSHHCCYLAANPRVLALSPSVRVCVSRPP